MTWKKLIPYPEKGIKRLARGLVLDHRAKVISLANIFSRSVVVKARSHDNSCISEEELIYTEWMANQDVDLTDDGYQAALEHHYENNDHHLQHFKSPADMSLQQLSLYLCDVMTKVSWEKPANDAEFMRCVRATVESDMGACEIQDKTLVQILMNTAEGMVRYDKAGVRSLYNDESKKKKE